MDALVEYVESTKRLDPDELARFGAVAEREIATRGVFHIRTVAGTFEEIKRPAP